MGIDEPEPATVRASSMRKMTSQVPKTFPKAPSAHACTRPSSGSAMPK